MPIADVSNHAHARMQQRRVAPGALDPLHACGATRRDRRINRC